MKDKHTFEERKALLAEIFADIQTLQLASELSKRLSEHGYLISKDHFTSRPIIWHRDSLEAYDLADYLDKEIVQDIEAVLTENPQLLSTDISLEHDECERSVLAYRDEEKRKNQAKFFEKIAEIRKRRQTQERIHELVDERE